MPSKAFKEQFYVYHKWQIRSLVSNNSTLQTTHALHFDDCFLGSCISHRYRWRPLRFCSIVFLVPVHKIKMTLKKSNCGPSGASNASCTTKLVEARELIVPLYHLSAWRDPRLGGGNRACRIYLIGKISNMGKQVIKKAIWKSPILSSTKTYINFFFRLSDFCHRIYDRWDNYECISSYKIWNIFIIQTLLLSCNTASRKPKIKPAPRAQKRFVK